MRQESEVKEMLDKIRGFGEKINHQTEEMSGEINALQWVLGERSDLA